MLDEKTQLSQRDLGQACAGKATAKRTVLPMAQAPLPDCSVRSQTRKRLNPDRFEPVRVAASMNEALFAAVGTAQSCDEGLHEQLTAVAGNRVAAPNV